MLGESAVQPFQTLNMLNTSKVIGLLRLLTQCMATDHNVALL